MLLKYYRGVVQHLNAVGEAGAALTEAPGEADGAGAFLGGGNGAGGAQRGLIGKQ